MKLRINEDYYDNQTITEILWDIENSGDEHKIDKAYSYIDKWCDNPEEVCPDGYYDFTNASWGISEENIIEYLTNILNESVNITKRNINEKETPNIEVKNKGILEVPEGKNVDDLPLSHFVKLANKKGLSKITKALNNLQVWNKNDDPKLSKWAGNMIDKLNNKLKKDESLNKNLKEIFESGDFDEYKDKSLSIKDIDISDLERFIHRKLHEYKLWPESVDVSRDIDTIKIEIEISWGDWKHEHKRLDYVMFDIIYEYNPELVSHYYKEEEEITDEDGSDTYSAIHKYCIIEF